MKWKWTIACLMSVCLLSAQNNDPLAVEFKDFENALTGGFEAPQFQAINLNNDGAKDLLVFDRKGSAIRTFVYDEDAESKYTYAPEYESVFPPIPCWVIVRDYNGDGVDDLFTCGVTDPVTGIEVWTGSMDNGELSFTPYQHPHGFYNIIYYERNSEFKQLYVGNNGIPGIADVDDDGDIDVLAFQPSGGYLYYFKNMSVERGYGRDSLVYERVDECWGNFYEGGLIPDIVLSESNAACALPNAVAGAASRHEGITLSILDKDGDGLKDIIIGEVSSTNLIYVKNGGTPDDAFATYKEVDFPSESVPADMIIFLASFILDIDQDGQDDMLVAPNSLFATNTSQVAYYKGVDTSFQLVQDGWLVETTVDLGTDSYPSFLDYNADGKMDIVVGSFGLIGLETGTETRLFLFENIGTVDEPRYELVDDDYLGFLAFSEFNKSYTPTFGDLDGDGDVDLIAGSLSGDIIYSENTAGAGNPVNFSSPVFDYKDLNPENNTIKMSVADLNNDGLGDIIVGGRNSYSLGDEIASLKLFTNIGSEGNPDFTNSDIQLGLGQVNVKDAGTSKASAAPRFYMDGERPLLLVGNETGRFAVYEVKPDGEPYELLYENFLETYIGRRVSLDIADIDNDGFLEIVAGNERGGLNFFNTIIRTNGDISSVKYDYVVEDLDFFPNPAMDYINFSEPVRDLKIFNNVGQLVLKKDRVGERLDLRSLHPGIYFMHSSNRIARIVKL